MLPEAVLKAAAFLVEVAEDAADVRVAVAEVDVVEEREVVDAMLVTFSMRMWGA